MLSLSVGIYTASSCTRAFNSLSKHTFPQPKELKIQLAHQSFAQEEYTLPSCAALEALHIGSIPLIFDNSTFELLTLVIITDYDLSAKGFHALSKAAPQLAGLVLWSVTMDTVDPRPFRFPAVSSLTLLGIQRYRELLDCIDAPALESLEISGCSLDALTDAALDRRGIRSFSTVHTLSCGNIQSSSEALGDCALLTYMPNTTTLVVHQSRGREDRMSGSSLREILHSCLRSKP
ncbi:hypothetical protein PsYK624_026000 [Phanerochaete sordida]|uniref:RNI-like protein n=1 Tax=Phanerochaete sordida TaxID=48140 RepID=A0A9P3G2K9_9APHY|nr:hypothetical protein PsYK624_026000 [Phanerochaete sordida]